MPKIKCIHYQYLDRDGQTHRIGGVETYIRNLIPVCRDAGFDVEIFQLSNHDFTCDSDGATIIGVKGSEKDISRLVARASRQADFTHDILLFATDFDIQKSHFHKVLAIQHGVAWDIPLPDPVNDMKNGIAMIKGALRAAKKYVRYKKCKHLVCVDYNFVNWYRTQVAHVDLCLHVIPNFSEIPTYHDRAEKDDVSILFARRLVEYRGTRVFVLAIQTLMQHHSNIRVTIAGEGPEEAWMRQQLSPYPNVSFIRYDTGESLPIHQRHDIAVVPSLGSEGTSLSLLEAMAAGCAVIATYVGGMSNIILDGYNGLLISPDVRQLINALERLINDHSLRNALSQKGYETVQKSFSINLWRTRWREVIQTVAGAG
jgi:glycosyltransferase involved in cell wall biosynthesis